MIMQVSPLEEIAKDLPFFKTVDDREKLLRVVGALVLRRISLSKASEILGMGKERFLGLLDAMRLEYTYLKDQDVDVERKWQEPRSAFERQLRRESMKKKADSGTIGPLK
jgi:predicted HTH domain antitoxin